MRKKKTKKMRGRRTFGHGSQKKRRGKGSKGGKGFAGSLKHKKIKIMKEHPGHIGKKGFVRKNKKEIDEITLKRIDEIAKKTGKNKLSFPNYRVLGTGKLTSPVEIEATYFTKNAKKKIEEIGGKFIELS